MSRAYALKLRTLVGSESLPTLLLLLSLMGLSAVAELALVASFVPFATLVTESNRGEQSPLLWLYDLSGLSSERQLMALVGGFIVALFLAAGALRSLTQWACSAFAWRRNAQLAQELLSRYLNQPYSWYLTRSTSDLTRDVVSEVSNLVDNVLRRLLVLCSRLFTVVLLGLGLLWAEPVVALSTGCLLMVTYSLVYRLLKRQLTDMSTRRLKLSQRTQRVVSDALCSIKEARATHEHRGFLESHAAGVEELRRVLVTRDVYVELPTFLAETVAIVTILGAAAYLSMSRGDPGEVVGLAVLYLASLIRLTPLLQLAYSDLVRIKFFQPSLDLVCAQLAEPASQLTGRQELPFEREVALKGVRFRYPEADNDALTGVSLKLPKGGCIGLVGVSGGGKTTIADIMAGLLIPSAGELLIDGKAIGVGESVAWSRQVGYVPQEVFLCDEPVWSNIALGVPEGEVDWAQLEEAARTAGIDEFIREELPSGYHSVLGERGVCLSGGQRQRIGIARALYRDPEVLILDEATSALDNATEATVRGMLEQLSRTKTMLIVAHRLSTVKACQVIYLVREGEVQASGSYQELAEGCVAFQALLNPSLPNGGSAEG